MTFRGILLDFFPTADSRFDCELARFSAGLRVKHLQDMRFIKGEKEKKEIRHHPTYCHSRESGNPWPALAALPTLLCCTIDQTVDSRFRGNDKKGLEKPASPICATPYFLLAFYETSWHAI